LESTVELKEYGGAVLGTVQSFVEIMDIMDDYLQLSEFLYLSALIGWLVQNDDDFAQVFAALTGKNSAEESVRV